MKQIFLAVALIIAAGAKVFTTVNDLIDACRRDYVGK